MMNLLVPLLLPLALTTGPDLKLPPSYHRLRAYVTGYNTITGQTDESSCIAASGADICGRHDAVACPSRIRLGTVVEIWGTAYVCEDRPARRFDSRFDISCDKDTACPSDVTGWTTIRVYGDVAASTDRPVHHAGGARFAPPRTGPHAVAWRARPAVVSARMPIARR